MNSFLALVSECRGYIKAMTMIRNRVSTEVLLPLAELYNDPTRNQIDQALCPVLSLPSLSPIRELLVRELGITGR